MGGKRNPCSLTLMLALMMCSVPLVLSVATKEKRREEMTHFLLLLYRLNFEVVSGQIIILQDVLHSLIKSTSFYQSERVSSNM